MTTIQQFSIYSQAALASYVQDLIPQTNNYQAYVKDKVGIVKDQALAFDKAWDVIQQSSSTNGFSAVLLKNRTTDEKVIAIAGTDRSSAGDVATDLIIAEYGTALNMPQYMSLDAFYTQLVCDGKLGASEQLVVTGHSLGGFLDSVGQLAEIISERPVALEAT